MNGDNFNVFIILQFQSPQFRPSTNPACLHSNFLEFSFNRKCFIYKKLHLRFSSINIVVAGLKRGSEFETIYEDI